MLTSRIPGCSHTRSSSWRLGAVAALLLSAGAAHAQVVVDGVRFVDRAQTGEITLGNYRGSLGVIDYNNDGWMDLVVADNAGAPRRLFRNNPDAARPGFRTFTDVTVGSGFDDDESFVRNGGTVVVFDYDNDGDSDVFFGGFKFSEVSMGQLYRNDGGTFTNVSIAAGVRAIGFVPESASAMDDDLDGDLDLLVCCISGSSRTFLLYRNQGNGTFVQQPASAVPNTPVPGHIYAHLWTDWNHDGRPEGFILVSGGAPVVLSSEPDGAGGRRLVNVGPAVGFTSLGPAPMGIAAGDMDNDGDLDLAITDAAIGTYYENRGTSMARVTPFATFFGWGVTWLDVDNDGDLDNYQAGSWGNANIDRLTRNNGAGSWTNISSALNTVSLASQYSVQIDFNNDGRQDLVTVNPGVPGQFISVYENLSTTPGHWASLQLRGGNGVNMDAAGAVVRVMSGGVTQVREISVGSSTASTEDLRAHFGLGAATVLDRVEIVWPRSGPIATRTTSLKGPFLADRVLTFSAPCPADLNVDGEIDFSDIEAFIGVYVAGSPRADFNGDGEIDFSDIESYLGYYNAPC